jgi:DNA-directed RNA polymerase subunit RPC12/RpoP
MASSPTLPRVASPAGPSYLRLSACPHCGGRRRVLVEVAGEVRGRCLDCGAELAVPLDTERHHRELIVGRGGQGIVEVLEGAGAPQG